MSETLGIFLQYEHKVAMLNQETSLTSVAF